MYNYQSQKHLKIQNQIVINNTGADNPGKVIEFQIKSVSLYVDISSNLPDYGGKIGYFQCGNRRNPHKELFP